jgi:hypothetical protein
MASTTNFNWTTPDNTSLLKDGASAIRTLGSSIDTTMAELKGGTTGQVLSKTSNTDMDFTWVAQDDANAIQNTQLTAKGALISAFSAGTPATLTVGANNTFLRANSSAATGLEYAGAYTSFTPAYFQLSVGNGTSTGRFLRIGNYVHVEQSLTFGSTTSISGNIFCDFPTGTANTANNGNHLGLASYTDTGTLVNSGILRQNSGTNFALEVNNASGSYTVASGVNATVPFTWVNTDQIILNYIYEVA